MPEDCLDKQGNAAATVAAAPPAIGRKVAIASLYMVSTRFIIRGIGVIGTLVLVRLLSPDDFGLASAASAVYAILDLLTTTSFNLALLRMREPERAHYDTAWTMTVLRGLIIAAGLILTSDAQANFMGDARVAPLMWALAGTALLQSLESVQARRGAARTALQRHDALHGRHEGGDILRRHRAGVRHAELLGARAG